MKIKFAGPVAHPIRQCIKANNLDDNYIEMGNISRKYVLELNASSKLLLLPINKAENAMGRIPGKLYEYLRSQIPILCFGPVEGDVAKIINKTKSGKTFTYDDYNGVKDFILDKYNNFARNSFSDITEFTNENQTKLIAKYLDEITGEKN